MTPPTPRAALAVIALTRCGARAPLAKAIFEDDPQVLDAAAVGFVAR